jgi:uncharacterized protein YciI
MIMSGPAIAEAGRAGQPQWLARITLARSELHDPTRWSAAETNILAAHFNYWERLTSAGPVVLAGRTLDEDGQGRLAPDAVGLIIFEAPDRVAAERMMTEDPGVKAGLWRYKLNSYRVALSR